MFSQKIKILSFIKNMRKIIFACPICLENNSIILDEDLPDDMIIKFKCQVCARSISGDFHNLQQISELTKWMRSLAF